jgi:hypothetical protein
MSATTFVNPRHDTNPASALEPSVLFGVILSVVVNWAPETIADEEIFPVAVIVPVLPHTQTLRLRSFYIGNKIILKIEFNIYIKRITNTDSRYCTKQPV